MNTRAILSTLIVSVKVELFFYDWIFFFVLVSMVRVSSIFSAGECVLSIHSISLSPGCSGFLVFLNLCFPLSFIERFLPFTFVFIRSYCLSLKIRTGGNQLGVVSLIVSTCVYSLYNT